MKKKHKILICLIVLLVSVAMVPIVNVGADVEVLDNSKHYIIFDENGEKLLEKSDVFVGDYYITSDYKKYEIISVDDDLGIGTARFLYTMPRPNVTINNNAVPITSSEDKIICLYMTHNDESYVPTDGVDSVYGEGGIHDVAKRLANSLRGEGITTYIDETLHIPHDSNAYSRSAITCRELLEQYSPNAIFDIHRDGTSRAYYITNVNGNEESMVRIVVGKANSNMAINEEFALYIMAVAQEISPGLIKDIYYASGHYNQGQYAKSLLFEMGSHMVEKELVLESADKLANVINTAMFATTVDDNSGDVVINDIPTEDSPVIDKLLEEKIETSAINENSNTLIRLFIWSLTLAGIIWLIIFLSKVKLNKK